MLSAVQDINVSIEPEDEYKELEAIDEYEEQHNESNELVEEAYEENIPDDKFDEEPDSKVVVFDSNKFNHLLKKAYGNNLSKQDKHLLATYIYLLANERNAKNIESDSQKRLDQYIYNFMYDD